MDLTSTKDRYNLIENKPTWLQSYRTPALCCLLSLQPSSSKDPTVWNKDKMFRVTDMKWWSGLTQKISRYWEIYYRLLQQNPWLLRSPHISLELVLHNSAREIKCLTSKVSEHYMILHTVGNFGEIFDMTIWQIWFGKDCQIKTC